MLSPRVLPKIRQKLNDSANRTTCSNPTHGLPQIPLTGEKLRNAI